MKLFIKHNDTNIIKDIVERMVVASGDYVLTEKPELDKDIINEVVKVVKHGMNLSLDILLTGSSDIIIEYDVENAIAQSYEQVAKSVKLEKIKDELELK